ncbi:MAG: nucleotidyltransferase family protein [Gemmatimonadota bacterium]|jgi:hypothetical protein|nr:nucleotidyltransferase family protein [Gemmatimonadota bacterium]
MLFIPVLQALMPLPRRTDLTREEWKSVTHSDFWIPHAEREKYKRALGALNNGGIPYVITGAYAIYEHTGIYRETKDLDLFVEPGQVVSTMRILRAAGFRTRLVQAHWLAKAELGDHVVDVIFGMGNGLAPVDGDWYRHSRPAILAAHPVRIAPPEELIWHRLFIHERHRQDTADILHLILCRGEQLDWDRLVRKTAGNWPLLLSKLILFPYIYPEARGKIPERIVSRLLEEASADLDRPRTDERMTRGPLVSRFSFSIDVNEWGMRDARQETVAEAEHAPVLREIALADVWDERSRFVLEFLERTADEPRELPE